MDSNTFREVAMASIEEIATYYDTLPERKVLPDVQPGYLRKLLPSKAPMQGEPMAAITADISSKILPGITHWQSPKFMAFFPCSSSFPAMIAELYSNAFNGAHFNWICSPAVTELETIAIDWLAQALALPECYLSTSPTRGGGVIHGTASEAILTVMVAARDRLLRERTAHLPDGDEKDDETAGLRSRLVALGGAAAHSSTKKAAQILGVRFRTVPVPPSHDAGISAAALAAELAACRQKGLLPFYVTATYGSTDTCAIDDLAGIAELCASDGDIWVHVDAAYAGAAMVCPEYQDHRAALAAFHSFNINPHKWMLVNFDCSALWVRDRAWLVEALSVQPPYLRNAFSESGLVTDYRDWQIPLGRRFRSLKLWFVMRAYGIEGLRDHVRRGIGMCERLGEMLRSRTDLFEILTGPRFALVVFRLAPKAGGGSEPDTTNEATRRLYEAVNAQGEIYLISTVLDGTFAIRVCTANCKTEEHVKSAFDVLVTCAEGVATKGLVQN